MPNALTSNQVRDLARLGAKARLEELRTEIAAIEALLVETPSAGVKAAKRARTAKARGQRRKLSARGRANIIAAQKARWAKLKAEKNGTPANVVPAGETRRPRGRKAAAKK